MLLKQQMCPVTFAHVAVVTQFTYLTGVNIVDRGKAWWSLTHNLYADSDVLDTSIGQTVSNIRCLLLGVCCADTGW